MIKRLIATVAIVCLAVGVAAGGLFFSGALTSHAVQNPTLSLDMDPAGNNYSDPGLGGNNSMTVGTVDSCSTTPPPGDNTTHIHPVHVIVRDVEDLIGWQIRMNYDGGKMRPASFVFTPFTDTLRGQDVSFVKLPIDSTTGNHRDVIGATNIPPAAAGPQTALAGSSYLASQDAPISPDTPAKAVPDDTSYSAPTGGVVATFNLQVLAGNAGQLLTMDLDDGSPNPPGSKVDVFNGTGITTINLAESALGDGFHGEGVPCSVPPPTPTATPTSCIIDDPDFDNDGQNNDVDQDDDNDGIRDFRDRDDDNDGIRDSRDGDDDNDGIPDHEDVDDGQAQCLDNDDEGTGQP